MYAAGKSSLFRTHIVERNQEPVSVLEPLIDGSTSGTISIESMGRGSMTDTPSPRRLCSNHKSQLALPYPGGPLDSVTPTGFILL